MNWDLRNMCGVCKRSNYAQFHVFPVTDYLSHSRNLFFVLSLRLQIVLLWLLLVITQYSKLPMLLQMYTYDHYQHIHMIHVRLLTHFIIIFNFPKSISRITSLLLHQLACIWFCYLSQFSIILYRIPALIKSAQFIQV